MTTMTKRTRREAEALSRRNDERDKRKAAHQAMLAQHEARRAAMAAYKRYWSAWLRGGCVGPKPIEPK